MERNVAKEGDSGDRAKSKSKEAHYFKRPELLANRSNLQTRHKQSGARKNTGKKKKRYWRPTGKGRVPDGGKIKLSGKDRKH